MISSPLVWISLERHFDYLTFAIAVFVFLMHNISLMSFTYVEKYCIMITNNK